MQWLHATAKKLDCGVCDTGSIYSPASFILFLLCFYLIFILFCFILLQNDNFDVEGERDPVCHKKITREMNSFFYISGPLKSWIVIASESMSCDTKIPVVLLMGS